jgi:hypothetical protein
MPNTFTKIASVTVGAGGASGIDFTSIPATYTDLCVKVSGRSNEAVTATNLFFRVNSSSTAVYGYRYIYGNPPGGNGVSGSGSSQGEIYAGVMSGASATASTFGSTEIYIPNYAGNSNKSFSIESLSETNATAAFAFLTAGVWANTSPITAVNILPSSGTNFVQYSTATLYGISKS